MNPEKRRMISKSEVKGGLSVEKQCELLDIPVSTFYGEVQPAESIRLKEFKEARQVIEVAHKAQPSYGARRLSFCLNQEDIPIGRKFTKKLMDDMGIHALYPKPNTSKSDSSHKKYPYLLHDIDILRPNQVWATDITYIRLSTGWVYLVAVIDWYSRKILSWRLSNSMDVSFCIEALKEALSCGKPEIFNTDQGSQFTSNEFIDVLKESDITISMDGKGRALDNVIIERFWWTIKHEHIHIHCYEKMSQLRNGIKDFILHYNEKRPHSSHGNRFPSDVWKNVS
jgi:putative transposase